MTGTRIHDFAVLEEGRVYFLSISGDDDAPRLRARFNGIRPPTGPHLEGSSVVLEVEGMGSGTYNATHHDLYREP